MDDLRAAIDTRVFDRLLEDIEITQDIEFLRNLARHLTTDFKNLYTRNQAEYIENEPRWDRLEQHHQLSLEAIDRLLSGDRDGANNLLDEANKVLEGESRDSDKEQ